MSAQNRSRRIKRRHLRAAFVYLALIALMAVFLFPALWVVGLSLKTRVQVFAPEPLFLWVPTLENYLAVLPNEEFRTALTNSVITSIGTLALSLFAGVPAAYAFARFPFRGSKALFYALLLMRMLPPIAVLVPMYAMFSKLGLTNTLAAVILATTTFSLPLVVWILRDFFEDMPRELEESACVDGATKFQAFYHIVLPLVRPGLVAVSMLSLVLVWNDFLFASVLTNNATRTLPVLMAAYVSGDSGIEWGSVTATGVLVVLPVIAFSFFTQKHLVAGLSSGAVKG